MTPPPTIGLFGPFWAGASAQWNGGGYLEIGVVESAPREYKHYKNLQNSLAFCKSSISTAEKYDKKKFNGDEFKAWADTRKQHLRSFHSRSPCLIQYKLRTLSPMVIPSTPTYIQPLQATPRLVVKRKHHRRKT